MTAPLRIDLPAELVEEIAQRAAEILAERQPSTAENGSPWLAGASAAADYLGCPASRIYALVNARRIPFEKDGSRLLFDRRELDEYIRDGGGIRP